MLFPGSVHGFFTTLAKVVSSIMAAMAEGNELVFVIDGVIASRFFSTLAVKVVHIKAF